MSQPEERNMALELESPCGPAIDRREGDNHMLIGGTYGFGVTPDGRAFFDPAAAIAPEESADLQTDKAMGRFLLVVP
jgi:hypothetical protein